MAWKVAICLAASYDSIDSTSKILITSEILEEALKVLSKLEANMPHAFGGYGQSELADVTYKVWSTIDATPGITSKKIMRRLIFEIKDQIQLMVILNNLIHTGLIRKMEEEDEPKFFSVKGG